MLARIWIETLKRERQQLDSADEAQAGRRYALTRLIKALEQVAPWEARTALLTAELARHEPVLSAPSA